VVKAVEGALSDPASRTRDLGGSAGLDAITDAIVARVGDA
jgi:isocitrate/isopropylmalate dehydrogenase